MNVKDSIAAYHDGTFEKKTQASAERRQSAKKRESTSSVQRGRDLYESMYPEKEQ